MVQYLKIEDRQDSLSLIFCYCKHCTKSKFCAIRNRSKIIEPLLESYLQVLVTTSLNGFTSYLLAIV